MNYKSRINALQYLSIMLMWGFAVGLLIFIPWLVTVAFRWNDALNWTVTIVMVMTPVYLTVAATLTYVFFGLRRGARKDEGQDPS